MIRLSLFSRLISLCSAGCPQTKNGLFRYSRIYTFTNLSLFVLFIRSMMFTIFFTRQNVLPVAYLLMPAWPEQLRK